MGDPRKATELLGDSGDLLSPFQYLWALGEYGIKQQLTKTPGQVLRETTEGTRNLFSKFGSASFVFEDFMSQQVPSLLPLGRPLHCVTTSELKE